jgi:surface protein
MKKLLTQFEEKRDPGQSGINMVDLMMWLVIAALLLAAAIQGIGYYQKNAMLYSMKNDALHAAEAVMARVSSVDGEITDTVVSEATTDSAKTSDVTTVSESGSNDADGFVIRSSSDSVDSDVVFLSKQRGTYSPGVHIVPEGTVIAADGTETIVIEDGGSEGGSGGATGPAIDTSNVMTTVWDTRLSYDANYGTGNPVNMVPCTTISVPITGDVDATIDWGDGSPVQTVKTSYATMPNAASSHTYTGTAGLKTVTITGQFSDWVGIYWIPWTQGCITNVTSWGDGTGTTEGTAGFSGAVNLTDVARIPLTMTVLDNFLSANSAAFTGDSLNQWDVSNVTDMTGMFAEMKGVTGDVSGWDTSNVEWMGNIFAGSSFNGDISNWDVRKVKRLSFAFAESSFNGDISKWETISVTEMPFMFQNATSFNQNLSGWDVSKVTSYGGFGSGSALTTQNRPLFK